MKALGILLSLLLLAAQPVSAQTINQDWLQAVIDGAYAERETVAIGAALARLDEPVLVAVAGTTRKGNDTPAEPGDAWHIGSNTKALTALLYARLVEAGEAEWGASVADLFAGHVETVDPSWRDVTIEDLFAHRSGVGQLGPVWLLSRGGDTSPLTEQRLDTVANVLKSPPKEAVGEFEYSNLNYVIAGSAIELITGESWEDAIATHVFEIDGSEWSQGWGTGAPQTGLQGHRRNLFGFKQSVGRGSGADNPAALGPAGTLHAPLGSHARLLLEFIDTDSVLVTDEMRDHLLAPWPDEEAGYAMGWGVYEDAIAGRVYIHNGSNTMWFSRAVLMPSLDAVIVVNANEFSEEARKTADEIVAKVAAELAKAEDDQN